MTDPVRTGDGNVTNIQPGGGAESLDTLAGIGATVDAAGAPAAPGQAAQVVQEVPQATEQDVTDMLITAREMAAPAIEETGALTAAEVERIWNDKALARIARPLVSIMNRHGVGMGEAFEKFGPYVMLLAGIAGPAFATYKAIRNKAVEAEKGGAPDASPQ